MKTKEISNFIPTIRLMTQLQQIYPEENCIIKVNNIDKLKGTNIP